jgi:GNAT superfamily N-acetyltransferase
MLNIEKLAAQHNRKNFSCGVDTLDNYLHQRARLDMERGMCVVYVLADADAIYGFYTLSASSIVPESLPHDIAKRYPNNLPVPCYLIGRLAVDTHFQKMHYGAKLVTDALRVIKRGAASIGAYCAVVDAKNELLIPFYEKFGFKRIADNALRLYLPIGSIAE